MKITKLIIENFKSFENVIINLNKDINIFIGVNNGGKSTVLEAIALWCECFNLLIKQSQKSVTGINVNKGEYKLGDKSNILNYNEIISVRSPNFEDIFFNLETNRVVKISAIISDNKNEIDIGFSIKKGSGGNYGVSLKDYSTFDYKRFNDFFEKFPNPINVIYAMPINSLLPYEEFATQPKVNYKIRCRESIGVLRNRLYQLKKTHLYLDFIRDLSYILNDDSQSIDFQIIGDEHKDVQLEINIKLGAKDTFKSLSLLGSGTLQMLEILLSLYEEKKDLSIVLLDEPDSHIHRDIQKRLINILINHTKDTQVLMTTHNESLIRSSKPEYLFYLEKGISKKEYTPIINEKIKLSKSGLQPSKQIKILQELGSETGLDIINALEADKLILVEGATDARSIDILINKAYIGKNFNVMYWVFDGIDNLLPKLQVYKELFSFIKNGKSLWDKSVLVIDKDYLTNIQGEKFKEKLSSNYNIPVFMWNSYTMESSILENISEFKSIMANVISNVKGIIINEDDFSENIDRLLKEVYFKYLDLYNEDKLNGKVSGQLRTRRDNIDKALSNAKILPGDSDLYITYKKYAKECLENKEFSEILDKDDIKKLILEIFKSYDIVLESTVNVFEYVLENMSRSNLTEEWKSLCDLVIRKCS